MESNYSRRNKNIKTSKDKDSEVDFCQSSSRRNLLMTAFDSSWLVLFVLCASSCVYVRFDGVHIGGLSRFEVGFCVNRGDVLVSIV